MLHSLLKHCNCSQIAGMRLVIGIKHGETTFIFTALYHAEKNVKYDSQIVFFSV